MRGPKPNYTKDGVKGSNYGPKSGLTDGTAYPEPTGTITGTPFPQCVSGLVTHIQPNQELWLRPDLLFAGFWDPTRTPTYFRIVVDPGGGGEISSGNIGWEDTFVIPNGCPYVGPSPGVPWPVRLWAGNSFGEDFCDTTVTMFDLDTVCAP